MAVWSVRIEGLVLGIYLILLFLVELVPVSPLSLQQKLCHTNFSQYFITKTILPKNISANFFANKFFCCLTFSAWILLLIGSSSIRLLRIVFYLCSFCIFYFEQAQFRSKLGNECKTYVSLMKCCDQLIIYLWARPMFQYVCNLSLKWI